MILYHYTSTSAFDQILRTREILPSDPWTTMDFAYGRGWYFTDIPPTQCDAWTVAYCWRSLSVFNKVESYLEFDVPDGLATRCREHVYMIGTWDKRITYLEGKQTPKCPKGPCLACAIISTVKQFLGLT